MKFFKFIENSYQTLAWDVKLEFDIKKDSKVKSLHQMMQMYRSFLKWAYIPKFFLDYWLVCLKLKKEPEPLIENKVRENKLQEEKIKQEKESLEKEPRVSSTESEVVPEIS